ncbi:caspase family protein [Klugiella xanthotipulae]|uniref:Caspase domain-containing protein n=1 Tax=Klugiella xanthotipulae TaxID=244735 RepID=A0A543HSK7_9MICO|nr:caspase family protein [Klugiella xanthotipulae]TQM61323.1 caspase domain-containing protein [Klugiella xanthotipulae]
MKRALLVGIDYYQDVGPLFGCVNDASSLHPLLARNEDDSPNLECRLLAARDANGPVTRDQLLGGLDELLASGPAFALFYFAGHGSPRNGDVTLVTSDATEQTPGVAFAEVLAKISQCAPHTEILVILDCCFSGGAGTIESLNNGLANLRKGLTVLTASRDDQPSAEAGGRGMFSTYLEGALEAGAADVLGHVNVSGLYAYLSESFGAWEQRPTFKANIDRLHDIRKCEPRVPLPTLRKLTEWFPNPEDDYSLDPSYEPTAEPEDLAHEDIFAGLQKYRACRLVEPVDEDHLYYAAMNSKGCRLTALGKHYWHMVKEGRI